MEKESDIKIRVLKLIEELGVSERKFCLSVGVSTSFVRNMSESIGSDKIYRILLTYPNLNLYWLIAGEGSMFREDIQSGNNVIRDSNTISGSNITGQGHINNTINIEAPPEGYEKIIKPDLTMELRRLSSGDDNRKTDDLHCRIELLQQTIESQKLTIEAQKTTIEVLKNKKG